MSKDLIVPIYVDTSALLDLLASIEGGFATAEKVTTRSAESSGTEHNVKADGGTEFGIPNILSLLKLTLGYAGGWKKSSEDSHEREVERYHTYGSLFFRLRDYLEENTLIKRLDDSQTGWDAIQFTDFVEVRGVFRPNPFANTLEIIDRTLKIFQVMMELPSAFQQEIPKGNTPEEQRKNREAKQKLQQDREVLKSQQKQMEVFGKFLQGILTRIQTENIRVFVVDMKGAKGYKATTLLTLDYLRDHTMTELSNKEYRLLGKVVRKVETDDPPIDLLLGTGLSGIGRQTLEQFMDTFQNLPGGMNLPSRDAEIRGPALEIVPIAIFV